MSDKLEWMNRHAVLLREPQWANIAARENYKIRADLRPLFDAHPDSLELLDAMVEKGLCREGCEFIARMTHRRAAVWWGYCCLLDLFEERHAVATGAAKPAPTSAEEMMVEIQKLTGIGFPKPVTKLTPETIDDFCKAPQTDIRKMLEFPKPPPQDRSALNAAAAGLGGKLDRLMSFIPPEVGAAYDRSFASAERSAAARYGQTVTEYFAQAKARAEAGPLTYTVDRFSHPTRQAILKLPEMLETQRKGMIAQIKNAFPEKFPATPEAKFLLAADAKKRSDNAIQAVWRWIVSPDERNTTLALQAGNEAPATAEGLLAYTAAWSFGDLAPEGKVTVPVPPELPGTGLNSVLLMLALDQDGYRKMPERYELYFKMGMDVVFGKNLWTEAVSEKLSPHAKLEAKYKG